MLRFRRKRRQTPGDGVSPEVASLNADTRVRRSVEWRAWKHSEQTLIRRWNEWLAADLSRREFCYRRYMEAMAGEAHAAAELERSVAIREVAADAPVKRQRMDAARTLGSSTDGCHAS